MTEIHPALLAAAPYLADPTPYPIMVRRDGEPTLVQQRYAEMSRFFRTRWARTTWLLGWRCFFTGVHLHGYDRPTGQHPSRIPWALSKDHLVPYRHKRFLEAEFGPLVDASKVLVGMRLNRSLGHDPLAVRIVIRRHLLTLPLDRERPTMADHDACYHGILAAKETMIADGGYVWQETNFVDEGHKRRARMCFAEMLDVERDFLRTPEHERNDWIENFEWKW